MMKKTKGIAKSIICLLGIAICIAFYRVVDVYYDLKEKFEKEQNNGEGM